MRTLAIETSTRRCSLALVESGREVAISTSEQPGAHGEALLGLLERSLALSGWSRTSLDLVAVGIGPGSFTGLRVGIAFAQGVGIGLARPVRGVGSLLAMAAAVPPERPEARFPVLDARRGEVFVAGYRADGEEIMTPVALSPELAAQAIASSSGAARLLLIGEGADLLPGHHAVLRSPGTDLPHATTIGRVAETLRPSSTLEPLYIRPADAIRPNLPPSPLCSARSD